ncbi:MAG: hypothetical protein JWO32_2781 [Bacteroidetes bacterium]|nr:hypothetical protein [Bacteroidota bacterium]
MKKRKSIVSKVLFILALQYIPFIMHSQAIVFSKTYPTTFDKTSRDIMPTADGGYLLTGYTNTSNQTDCDLYVMKTDNMGNLLWEKAYGGNKPEYSYNMCATSDGNYFIIGYSQSFGGGDYDVYLIKIDPAGTLLWQKTYGSFGNDEGREIVPTADGNYAIVGTMNANTPSHDAFLMKIDLAGAVLWTKYYGGVDKEYGNSVKQCQDGGFIIGGQTYSFGSNGDTYVVKTDPTGVPTWTNTYGTPLSDEAVSILENNDGSFTFAVRDSTANQDIDVRIIKTDAMGTTIWNKVYGSTLKDTPKSICKTADGGYFVGAISRSFGWVNPQMWLLKLDGAGDSTWTRQFGGPDHEHCYRAKEWDYGYIAIGHSKSFTPGQKVMFVKMSANGTLVAGFNEHYASADNLKVYPNPSSDGLIRITTINNISSNVRLTNALGQTVYSGAFDSSKSNDGQIIDLSAHQPGVYLLSIETSKGIESRKIVLGK